MVKGPQVLTVTVCGAVSNTQARMAQGQLQIHFLVKHSCLAEIELGQDLSMQLAIRALK